MEKTLATFQKSLNAAARGLWSGQLDALSAADSIFSTLWRGYTQAWRDGAAECGVKPDEWTKEERDTLAQMVGDSSVYVGGLCDFISQHTQAQGYRFSDIQSRLSLWVNRYEEVSNTAKTLACGNAKLAWRLGNAEHCRTCLKLANRVHRASFWKDKGIAPRMITNRLKCNGYRCDCRFEVTDEPLTRGRFPNLP